MARMDKSGMWRKAFALMMALVFSVVLSGFGYAAENEFGNQWVYDEAQVVSADTEEYVKGLNESVFTGYENKPQLSIVVISELPYGIDDYKRDLFNEYGIGTAEENCGMLFIFAINDREYALEIGDGFKQGSLLRKDLETDFITEDMKVSLRAGDYDAVVRQVADYLAGIMADEENGVYSQREAELLAKKEAQEAEAAARLAAFEAGLKKLGIAVCFLLSGAGVVLLAVYLGKKLLRKRKLTELIERNRRYISLAQVTGEEFAAYLNTEHGDISGKELERQFLVLLHRYYLGRQMALLEERATVRERLALYKSTLRDTNDFSAFKSFQLVSLDNIICSVDEQEREKAEIMAENGKRIDRFLQENRHRIVHESTFDALRDTLYGKFQRSDEVVNESMLEAAYAKELNDLNFRWEMDRFIEEHADQAKGQFFDRDSFYAELSNSEQYHDYHYSCHYDRSWMYAMMVMHMANRKRNHEEKVRRQEMERQREEKRRRREEQRRLEEAALRRATESMRSHNSSFGSGSGGGRSSGGGFKGGW